MSCQDFTHKYYPALLVLRGQGVAVCSPGLGSSNETRSQAYCLVAKTRIIYLTFSYLHATMREDRMSKLFRKISPYSEKHLHLLRVSSSTSSQWAGPSTALAYVCVWQQSRVSVWEKEDAFASNNCTETKGNSAYRNLEHPDALSFALGLNRGFQFT